MAQLNSALNIYQTDSSIQGSSSFGTASTTYISIPDPTATSTAGDQCQGLSLPTLPSGWTYHCAATSTNRNVDGTGWIPVNFTSISYGSPLGTLPVDPVNTTSSGNYYTYTPGGSFMLTATPESNKTRTTQADQTTGAITVGTDLTLSPLFNSSGLVGYWKFDEGSGTSSTDSSGNGNTGSFVNSPVWISGKIGNALSFSGGTNYVSLGSPTNLSPSQNMTISMWIKATSNQVLGDSTYSTLFFKSNEYWVRIYNGNGKTAFYRYTSAWGSPAYGASAIPTTDWTFVATVYDGAQLMVYTNGASSTPVAKSGTTNATTTIVRINVSSGGNENGFRGYIDDVRIYNRALSAAEIYALYSATR